MRTFVVLAVLAFACSNLGACGGGGGGGDEEAPPLTILQLDAEEAAVVGIWRPDDGVIDGNVAPTNGIGGPTTLGNNLFGVHRDSRGDVLLVADSGTGAVRFWDGMSGLSGDVAPTRVLIGANTQIQVSSSQDVYVDEARDLLYLSDENGVLVYANAATIDGNVAPVRNITGAATGLMTGDDDKRLFVDEVNDRLYVLDRSVASVFIWDNASAVDGNTPPSRTVAGAATNFILPFGLAVDVGRDLLYVADDEANAVFVFDGAASVNGNTAPSRTIVGVATTLTAPAGIDVDPESDRLYVVHFPAGPALSIWHGASTADGNIAPTRNLAGAATGIDNPTDVDVSR